MKPGLEINTSVQFLKSVGPNRARALARLGVNTVGDLLSHYPKRYFDRTNTVPIGSLTAGKQVTVLAEVLTCGERKTRRGGAMQTVTVGDDTGVLFCVWFRQRYILKQFKPGRKVIISGLVQFYQGRPQITHPDSEMLEQASTDSEITTASSLNIGRMVPVYGLTAGIGQNWLRSLVNQALDICCSNVSEVLPSGLRSKHSLLSKPAALRAIHFPENQQQMLQARSSLVYEEIFLIQMLMALRRQSFGAEQGIQLQRPGDLTTRLVNSLPFELTGSQRRVLAEILTDLRSGQVMHRLLQGDVGCGKTLVALVAALFVIEQGYQAVILAPTEVLARQHGKTIRSLVNELGVTSETLTGSTPAAERRAILSGVAACEIDLLVGTHAVIQEDVRVPRLGLAVVDEQHRFGVNQRNKTAFSGEISGGAHVLVMSATPIPRSLSLTLYGDLDLSLINELPAGRKPIKTHLVDEKSEAAVWESCHREIAAGHQVYVIYPIIEETEGQDLKAATVEYERLALDVFPDQRVALLHGRMKARDKDAVMTEFSDGKTQVLVATTVIEVGVDVPNATAMVIHNPERFGLAQLHQLRGRIGRGASQSLCWLLCDRFVAEESFNRIQFFAGHCDGFALAEEDLRLRGPGDIWGVRQHGVPNFLLANPVRDVELVATAQSDARNMLADDPNLNSKDGTVVARALASGYESLVPVRAG